MLPYHSYFFTCHHQGGEAWKKFVPSSGNKLQETASGAALAMPYYLLSPSKLDARSLHYLDNYIKLIFLPVGGLRVKERGIFSGRYLLLAERWTETIIVVMSFIEIFYRGNLGLLGLKNLRIIVFAVFHIFHPFMKKCEALLYTGINTGIASRSND